MTATSFEIAGSSAEESTRLLEANNNDNCSGNGRRRISPPAVTMSKPPPPLLRSYQKISRCIMPFYRRHKKRIIIALLLIAIVVWVMRHHSASTSWNATNNNGQKKLLKLPPTFASSAQESPSPSPSPFPKDFVWGSATSSYQIEGAVNEDGRGLTIWDTFCDEPNRIVDHSSGAVACDHYHRVETDVALMKQLGFKAYRFSIAWSRIVPNGTGQVNQVGIEFYNHLIDTLLKNDIQPWVTLYHWDLPQALEDEYGGWLNRATIDAFAAYARICFQAFGDRVTNWITLNESWTVAVHGYNDGVKAPGRQVDPAHETYLVGHHLILAHAAAATIYKQEFAPTQMGQIGIANCGDFRFPLDPTNSQDIIAADRAMIFQYAWMTDPFYFGDYPIEMKQRLGSRLPTFTNSEKKQLIGSVDFLGLNHYSSMVAAAPQVKEFSYGGYWADMFVDFSSDPSWKKNYMGWNIAPDGCRELLLWITKRYNNPIIYMTENGSAEDEPTLEDAQHDEGRRSFFEGYLTACAQAVALGAQLNGYFAWSFMDNFEWEYGYTRRFGICRVDYDTQIRTPKSSALWYSDTIAVNGRNLIP